MGAWGADPFGNDEACDWVYELEEKGYTHLISTLQKIVEIGSEYLELKEGAQAIAAADVISKLRGHFYARNSYTESIDAWVAENSTQLPTKETIQLALEALKRIRGERSEIQELWEGSNREEWHQHLDDLEGRLVI